MVFRYPNRPSHQLQSAVWFASVIPVRLRGKQLSINGERCPEAGGLERDDESPRAPRSMARAEVEVFGEAG